VWLAQSKIKHTLISEEKTVLRRFFRIILPYVLRLGLLYSGK